MFSLLRRAVLALLLITPIALIAKPTNPKAAPPAVAPKSASDLSIERIRSMEGPTNWGWLCADGRNFTLEGHIRWKATGYVRSDGVIVIMWVDITDDCLAPGTYRLHEKGLVGEWGHSHESRIGDDGKLEGVRRGDAVFNVLPPEPDI